MIKRSIAVVGLTLGMASVARADAFVTLTATTPEEPGGGYLPGTTVDFRVDMSQDMAFDISIRLGIFSELCLGSYFFDCLIEICHLSFDFSTIFFPIVHAIPPSDFHLVGNQA